MNILQREVQVAFSPRAQPHWFRLIKWSIIIVATARYRQRAWFPYVVSSTLIIALSLHFFYRWKTQGWTRAWGGWDDVAAE
jgi:hypothetical protein